MHSKPIFLLAGRTGGPITPLLAISAHLPYRPFIVGVGGGYEQQVAQKKTYPFLSLPATKLSSLSFKSSRWQILWELPWQSLRLLLAIALSCVYVFQHQPKAVLGAGGFTSVPMVVAVRLFRLLGGKTKIIIHQQDPLVGTTNKIALRLADVRSYVFDASRRSGLLEKAYQTPNPLPTAAYDATEEKTWAKKFPKITEFLKNQSKPVLLVFGGGSGAKIINEWVVAKINSLTEHFAVIHLTGVLQENSLPEIEELDYFRLEFALAEMPYLLKKANLVVCRAGLGSISELLYLQKSAFLVPLKGSHQEANAKEVSQYFHVLDQNQSSSWVSTIVEHYPTSFENIAWPDSKEYEKRLQDYYDFLQQSI